MVSKYFQRPENVKKRALELLDVGKRDRALDVLYDFIRRGRHRQHNFTEKELEPIMFMYLDLCVELKKSHNAKEGLFQYRNFCQNVNVASLENVVRGYLKNAEQKTDAARKESKDSVEEVDDLENWISPEQLMMSAVSGEDSQDRADRAILTPWVKFLWESYRQCLELLKTNSRVESLYHDTARQAFRFCVKYQRKTEFRKLCEILRKHLDHLKQHSVSSTVTLANPDTLARNIETWLVQLDHAIALELWQEAYRAIYELHCLMTLSKTKPKSQMMANYFCKLALVFSKAGHLLFHAAAVLRLFQLSRDLKKNMSQDDLRLMACRVVLAVLCVPLTPAHTEFDRFVETERNVIDKTERLASFFRMARVPTRESLLKDIGRLNIMQHISANLQQLYDALEVTFDPLGMCVRVQQCTDRIAADQAQVLLHGYIEPLHQVAQLRFIKQMSQVYQCVEMSRLVQLCPFTDARRLERVIVDAVRRNQLQIRIDHRQRQSVHFCSDLSEFQREDAPEGPTLQTAPSEQIRCHLKLMCQVLSQTKRLVNPQHRQTERAELRTAIHRSYQLSRARDHERARNRHTFIEQHKERIENLHTERAAEERSRAEQQERQQAADEQRRLEREAAEREKRRRDDEIKQIAARQLKTRIAQISQTSVGQKVISKLDEEELLKMDADEIMARQVEELEKERRELAQKLAVQWRRIDHLERAKRIEELPLLLKKYEEQKVEDAALWEEQQKALIAQAIEDHQAAVKHKERLMHMCDDKALFVDKLKSSRKSDFKAKLAEFESMVEEVRAERLEQRRRQRCEVRRQSWQQLREEEAQRRRDQLAKQQREQQEQLEQERAEQLAEERRRQREQKEAQIREQAERERQLEQKVAQAASEVSPWRESDARRPATADSATDSWRQPADNAGGSWRVSKEPGRGRDEERRDAPRADDDRRDWAKRDVDRRDAPRRDDDRRAWGRRDDEGRDGPRRDDDRRDWGRRDDEGRDGPRRDDDRRDWGRRDDERRDGPRRDDDRRDVPRRDDDRRDWGRRDDDRRDGPRRDDERRDWGRRDDERRDWGRRDDERRDAPRRNDDRRDWGRRDDERRDEPRRDDERRDWGRRDDDRRDWGRREPVRGDDRREDDWARRDAPRRDEDGRRDWARREAPRREEADGGSWRTSTDRGEPAAAPKENAWRRREQQQPAATVTAEQQQQPQQPPSASTGEQEGWTTVRR